MHRRLRREDPAYLTAMREAKAMFEAEMAKSAMKGRGRPKTVVAPVAASTDIDVIDLVEEHADDASDHHEELHDTAEHEASSDEGEHDDDAPAQPARKSAQPKSAKKVAKPAKTAPPAPAKAVKAAKPAGASKTVKPAKTTKASVSKGVATKKPAAKKR